MKQSGVSNEIKRTLFTRVSRRSGSAGVGTRSQSGRIRQKTRHSQRHIAFQIFEGKTDAATRTIPLPVHLWESLKQCVEGDLWKGSSGANGNKFGKLKEKALGRKDRLKVFHSFRHMTATAYEREHIEERIWSVIMGHKNKRGEFMTYGLYLAGLAPKQYLEVVERMIAGEYMQSYLSLFPQ